MTARALGMEMGQTAMAPLRQQRATVSAIQREVTQ